MIPASECPGAISRCPISWVIATPKTSCCGTLRSLGYRFDHVTKQVDNSVARSRIKFVCESELSTTDFVRCLLELSNYSDGNLAGSGEA